LNTFNLVDTFKMNKETLELFLLNVREHYFANSYHNFRHAFDVAQTAFCFIEEKELRRKLEPIDILVLLLSCICHDIEHGGFNNAYLANTGSELALIHNDISILENHHCYVTFKLLQHPKLNILAHATTHDQKTIRKRVINCILHTDMALHATYHMPILEQHLESGSFTISDETSRTLFVDLLAHLCDLSNVARPFLVSKNWCDRVTEEFFNQGELERLQGFPVRPNMDHTNTTVAHNMVSFIDILETYFKAFAVLVPEISDFIKIAFDNKREWEKMVKNYKFKKSEPP